MQEYLHNGESTVSLYFNDITTSHPLSREEEVALASRIEDGDMDARDLLVKANLRFVVDVARRYQNRGLALSDLISAGNVGLITAAERFDGTKGFKFISYAVWWIRQSILQAIAEHSRTVRLPLNKLNLLKDISEISRQLGQGHASPPDINEIAAELNLPPQEVMNALLSARSTRSLDETFDEGDERNLLETLADTRLNAPDEELLAESAQNQVNEVLGSLDERERFIIARYFGLDGQEALTLDQIGDLLGVTRERIRQIKERALGRLRHPSRYQLLKALIE
jgi:RNA polymerase primary sigma factor